MHFRTIILLLASSLVLVVLSSAGDASPPPVADAGAVTLPDGGGDNGIGTSPSDPTPASASVTTTSSTTVKVTTIPDLNQDPGGFVSTVLSSARAGQWRLFAACLLIGAVALARYALGRSSWFKTDRGGAVLVLGLALVGGVATSLVAERWSAAVLINSLTTAFMAAGGYAILKKLFAPSDKASAPASPIT